MSIGPTKIIDIVKKRENEIRIMNFWIHLKLLLWKNWLVRKRNKIRSVTEILWPILMISVVVILHFIGYKHVLPNCFMKAKAMPSAGEVLFSQTFFCTANNTCDSEKNSTMPCFNLSLISVFEQALQEAFNLTYPGQLYINPSKTSQNRSQFNIQFKDQMKDILILESLIEGAKKSQNGRTNFLSSSFFKNQSLQYTCDTVTFQNIDELKQAALELNLLNKKKKSPKENHYLNDNRDSDSISFLEKAKKKIYIAGVLNSFYQLLTKKLQHENLKLESIDDELNILDYIFCGPDVPQVKEQIYSTIQSARKKKRENEEKMDPGSTKYIVDEPEWENDTTDFCNEVMRNLESTYLSRIVFRLIKPLIRGKVIYTPDAPVINRLMDRINRKMSKIKRIIDFIKEAIKSSTEINYRKLQDTVNKLKNEEHFFRNIILSKFGKIFLKHFANSTIDDENTVNDHNSESLNSYINQFLKNLDETMASWKILLTSRNNSEFSNVIPYLECIDFNRIIPVSDEENALKKALYWLNRDRLWGLIVFTNIPVDAETLPPSITYKIRTGIESTPDTNHLFDRVFVPRIRRNAIYSIREISSGFAYLQNMIEEELIREYTGRKYVPGIYLSQTPYPCHIYDSFRDVITRTFPMFMVISWLYIFCMITKRIVYEKEILFKGTLRIFGVTATQYWISWFIDAFVPMIIATSALSLLLVLGGLTPKSNIFVIWLFLSSFILPTIALSFLVSTFFSKASFAMAVSGMIYFLLYLPYPPIQNFGEAINPIFKLSTCLISNVAFGLGCTWIANMEEVGIGAQLENIHTSPVPENPITMSIIIQMFLVDSVIYLLFAIYFDNILGANDFIKQPWYYCLTLPFRKKFSKEKDINEPEFSSTYNEEKNPKYFEPEPDGLQIGIQVKNLTKKYERSKMKKKAVNNLTINFYQDQITSFLGHNGAGKTTTISMMIGLLPITEGSVRIYGINIKSDPILAIKDIGICRQENVLLDDLTVEEHFKLFARLKNRLNKEVDSDTREIIQDLNLGHKADKPVKNLSGGMKRKVCVAMAFIGGSRTVFLDEPTAGIDPYSRRSIWELLIKYKRGRTIILTTHFLDEADILGDRIAIISSGTLQCCGSSMFLKTSLGRGYYLTIGSNERSDKMGTKAKRFLKDTEYSVQVQALNNLIQNVVPTAEFFEQIGSEIVFILPANINAESYSRLFEELDNNKEKMNFSSYGVTQTSLEEVFMKIILEAEEKENLEKDKTTSLARADPATTRERDEVERKEFKKIPVLQRINTSRRMNVPVTEMLRDHFCALIIKRFLHHKRNYRIILIEILLPTLFMAIALALAKTLPTLTEMPPLVIDLSAYDSASIFYTNNMPENAHTSAYEKVLLSPYDFGTKCVLYPEKCSLKTIPKGSLIREANTEDNKNCTCDQGFMNCVSDNSLKKPPNTKTSAGFGLFNLTGLNLMNWLVTTEFEYSARRMGGMSFGHFSSFTGVSIEDFLNLFTFEKFTQVLENLIIHGSSLIDPEIFTFLVMSTACNKTFGEQLFKNRDLADNILIWFNNRGWITSLAMMNGVSNLVLRASFPNNTDTSKYSIRLINHPLPITKRQLEDQIELLTNIALLCALSVIWALSFIPAMYAVYLVEEKVSGLKHLQIVSGISRLIYWCTNLFWDLISYSVSILSIIILYFLFNMSAFVGPQNISAFITLLYSYGFVNITFAYVISFWFSVPSSAFIFTACWNILTGVTTLLSTFTLTMISSKENVYYLDNTFMIFPQFCFGKSLINMALEGVRSQSLENFGVRSTSKSFEWNLTMKYIVIMVILGFVFFAVTLLLEYRIFQILFFENSCKKIINQPEALFERADEDQDVAKERERVESGKAREDGDVLIINNLTKIYRRGERPAVDHICAGVKRGECFGLLGLNGAGKTTVFKMLTGYISPSQGDAVIAGYSIRKDQRRAKLQVGYCPQVNALDPYLTVEEHLSFFCRIRGVTGRQRKNEISVNIERLGLTEQRNKIINTLSGGNKRKVNAAIALICDPELVLLDEPTSGMDVISRRFLWNCIQDVVLEGRCVVLTSHSMEECQALCTHLSIMANGKFMCFGSSQHLKSRFDEGYSVTVRLNSTENVEQVKLFFETHFTGSTLVYIHHLLMKFTLDPKVFIGTVFSKMSQAKAENLIQDYSVSQITLESIFLNLAKNAQSVEEDSNSHLGFWEHLCYFIPTGCKKQ